MLDRQVVRVVAQVTDLVPGNPARLSFIKRLQSQGREKFFSQSVVVPDDRLFRRLRRGVRRGDSVELTLKTVWDEASYSTVLVSFSDSQHQHRHQTFKRLSFAALRRSGSGHASALKRKPRAMTSARSGRHAYIAARNAV